MPYVRVGEENSGRIEIYYEVATSTEHEGPAQAQ